MPPFPFTAIVGVDDLRLALILNAVSPEVGGVLVRGGKGTAKSTAVRALAAVLPPVDVVADCRFSCDPGSPAEDCPDGPHPASPGQRVPPARRRATRLCELPVGATEDRLVGSLDLGRALTAGVVAFEPGLLAAAHRGVLYVDEVNLLHDHLVDLLLDAAALGVAHVERDAVSVRHAARFLLVGTMNPEEGELRPQLLDRFGLTVQVAAPREAVARAEVVRRRLAFDAAPDAFAAGYAEAQRALSARIAAARAALPAVRLPDRELVRIAAVCAAFEVDGLRADLVTARAAVAHAAWEGRAEVTEADVRIAAALALPHRRRRNPFDEPGLDPDQLDAALDAAREQTAEEPGGEHRADDPAHDANPDAAGGPSGPARERDESPPGPDGSDGSDGPDGPDGPGGGASADAAEHDTPVGDDASDRPTHDAPPATAAPAPAGASRGAAPSRVVAPAETFRARRLEVPGVGRGVPGRRSRAVTGTGAVVGADVPAGRPRDLHVVATMLAAAPHQAARGRGGPGLVLRAADLRQARREGREGNLVLFVVDASGSMAARARMGAVKAAVLSLLLDAYQRRDKIGLVTFRGEAAELALPPTSSVDVAAARLADLPAGGRTPLADGLLLAHRTLARERLRDPSRRPLLVVLTDGRHTAGPAPGPAAELLARGGVAAVVVDCETGRVRLGLAGTLAGMLGAPLLGLAELAAPGSAPGLAPGGAPGATTRATAGSRAARADGRRGHGASPGLDSAAVGAGLAATVRALRDVA
ncbi:magnesium chelatase subunit D [Parafrankia irregularis]|uniref:Mg-protoporphyrin IX chelatase n=1 Tax=Parafrankia irregularis TaxID=795642 RepID=A0A0S4QMD4_9ACTN|nr:VWA domain-containing protein [Parafrankia irregularis]CUU56805.1 magnesium chelatase subunit D [Parafrankia irregularis]